MTSKWFHFKSDAIAMRKAGASIRDVETELGIPRSTLSGWLKKVELTHAQKKSLHKRYVQALVTARAKASKWHREQKAIRVKNSEKAALDFIHSINLNNKKYLEVAVAFLYLGEGSKKKSGLSLGNTNPTIVKFFIRAIEILYNIPREKIRCGLNLRADQDPSKEIRYWAEVLELSFDNFTKPVIDRRTEGKPTFADYHGVCAVQCANVATQRKLMYIASEFCNKFIM